MADSDMDTSKLPSQIIVTTGIGNMITPAVMCKQPVTIPQYTTLNEVYDILAADSIGTKQGKDFILGYYGIGIKGSTCIGVDSNGITRMQVNQHQPTDFNQFFPIPFLVRQQNQDLDDDTRKKYRMRQPFTKNGIKYIAYYLKAIQFDEFDPAMELVTRDEATGNEVPEPYIPVDSDLHPVPIVMDSTGSVPTSNQYINASAKLNLSLTDADLDEIKNACKIMYNDSSYAAMNEYALVYGIETTTVGPIGDNASVTYNELLSACIAYHVTEAWARDANANGSVPLKFDIGASQPMLLGPRTTTPIAEGM